MAFKYAAPKSRGKEGVIPKSSDVGQTVKDGWDSGSSPDYELGYEAEPRRHPQDPGWKMWSSNVFAQAEDAYETSTLVENFLYDCAV